VYVEFGLQFFLRNAYSADLGPKCQSPLMANLSAMFVADPNLTGPLMTAALALGASRTSVDAYLAYCFQDEQVHTYEGMLNVTGPIVEDIGRFAMSDLGSPNSFVTKLYWFFWTGIDIRNCTEV
jgi:hypothetical protein